MPKADNEKKSRHWSLVARIVVAVAAIVWAFQDTDWGELAKVFQQRHIWRYFALSLATYALAQFIIALRWWLLLRAQAIHIRVSAAVRLFFVGLFFNNLMPSSVGGDLVKAWYVTKHTERRVEGVLSVFVDRFIGLMGMLLMAVVAYFLFLRGQLVGSDGGETGGAGLALAPYRGLILGSVLGMAALLAIVLVIPAGRARLRRLARQALDRGVSLVKRVSTALVVYCSRPMTMVLALGLTLLGQSMVIAAFWLLGRHLGVQAGLKYYFAIFPVTWVIGAIPVSIAGLGVLEAGIIKLFTLLTATTDNSAKALALCQRFVWVLASLPGGAIHLLGAHLPEQFLVDGENCAN
ncbi:MAG: flippase-like domain-containing protein [Phycisphaerales bacterium]|nr:MAG: flippase-like domain-containing protein [Phycisphaerales bacterium]